MKHASWLRALIWTLVVALGVASIAMAFLEPDPTIDWDEERISNVRHLLKSEHRRDA